MSGLVAVIGQNQTHRHKQTLSSMLAALRYNKYHNSGIYQAPDIGVHVGWVARQGASTDCQPITNETGTVVLILAGDVVSDHAVKAKLRSLGHDFPEKGLHYLVHLYEEDPTTFAERLNGWFAGIIIDHDRGICQVVNDRFGIKRIFYSEGDEIHLSTEAKAILNVVPETRAFDPDGLSELLLCGGTLGSQSLFRGIQVLPGATLWTVEGCRVTKKDLYFEVSDWQNQPKLSSASFLDQFSEIFPSTVRKYGTADERVGISLTGGLDSRMVISCLETQIKDYPCYTFGSMFRETFDVKIGRIVARHCGQIHEVIPLDKEFFKNFPDVFREAVYRSDGYLGLSGAGELFVNSFARALAPIRLTGNWGSELLRGARAFKAEVPSGDFLVPDVKDRFAGAVKRFNSLGNLDPVTFALFHQAPIQGYGRSTIENSQVTMRSPFTDNELVKLMFQKPVNVAGRDVSWSIVELCNSALASIPTDHGDLPGGSTIRGSFRKLLRRGSFKAEYWANHGMPDWLASVTKFIPWVYPVNLFLGRHKFQHFKGWLRGDLSSPVKDILLARRNSSGLLIPGQIENMVNQHVAGLRNYTDEIDFALTLALTEDLLL